MRVTGEISLILTLTNNARVHVMGFQLKDLVPNLAAAAMPELSMYLLTGVPYSVAEKPTRVK